MLNSIINRPLTICESFSLVTKTTKALCEWKNQPVGKRKIDPFVGNILKPLVARIVGFVTIPFFATADCFIHVALFKIKSPLVILATFTLRTHLIQPWIL